MGRGWNGGEWDMGLTEKSDNKESFACPKITMDHELGSFNHLISRFKKHL